MTFCSTYFCMTSSGCKTSCITCYDTWMGRAFSQLKRDYCWDILHKQNCGLGGMWRYRHKHLKDWNILLEKLIGWMQAIGKQIQPINLNFIKFISVIHIIFIIRNMLLLFLIEASCPIRNLVPKTQKICNFLLHCNPVLPANGGMFFGHHHWII